MGGEREREGGGRERGRERERERERERSKITDRQTGRQTDRVLCSGAYNNQSVDKKENNGREREMPGPFHPAMYPSPTLSPLFTQRWTTPWYCFPYHSPP